MTTRPTDDIPGDPRDRADALVRSACSSDVRRALALLKADPELAHHDLASACVAGEAAEVARRVQRDHAAANALTGPLGRAPISYACFSRLARADAARAAAIRETVRVLIAAGADPDARFANADGWVQSTLYGAAGIAGDPALTAQLIEAGAAPADDDDVHTVGEALYHAVEQRDPACARLLIEAGAKPSTVHFCLGRALNFPRLAMVRMLCEHGARPDAGHLGQAVWRRRGAETVTVLLDAGAPAAGDADEPSPLGIAVRWGDDDIAALLADRGAEPASVSDADRALGAYMRGGAGAAGRPEPEPGVLGEMLDFAVQRGDRVVVGRLLQAGAAPDGAPGEEHPPLASAAWRGHAEVVAELLAHGAATRFAGDGSALGAALHGSGHCQDPEGGPTMGTTDEVDRGRYVATVRVLLDAGASVPASFGADGGPSAAALLAELGLG